MQARVEVQGFLQGAIPPNNNRKVWYLNSRNLIPQRHAAEERAGHGLSQAKLDPTYGSFQKFGATIFGGPYSKDPSIQGAILGSLFSETPISKQFILSSKLQHLNGPSSWPEISEHLYYTIL